MDSVACAGDGTKPGTNLAGSASSSPKTARPTGPEGLGERGRPFDRAAAFGLFHDLIAPVQGALKGVAVLYVVASGPLSSIPLGVLVTAPPSGDGSDDDLATLQRTAWFADAYALITLPTLSSLSNETSDASASNPSSPVAFVGYGDPSLAGAGVAVRGGGRGVFMRSGGEAYSLADPEALRLRLQPLPGTAVELRAMAKALKSDPNALHMGADDTETTLRRDPQLSAARVIAFATHGLLPSDLQGLQEPGLVFTPPKVATEEDDGVLTASEVSQLHLSADWIILSACNTATSDGKPGADSLSSLARAFLYSGARALLASHWRVDDAATAALTVETLSSTQATAGLTRAQALQAAMRSIRTGTRSDGSRIENWTPEWSHPRSWGPFSLISNQDH
jgi:CHAT domain-containing protein